MAKREQGTYTFKLFRRQTKAITINQIVEKVEDLQNKGVRIDESVYCKDGFWGQMCTALGIPNNKNSRYRVQEAYKKSFVEQGQGQPEPPPQKVQPDFSPSPLNTCDTDSAEELPVQKTSKQVQPDFSPAPLNTCDTDSAEELPVQKTSKQVQPDFSPSPLNTCDTDSAEELPVQKTSKQVQPDFSPSPLNTCDTDSAEELPVQKTSKQVQPDFSPSPLNTCDTDSAEELPVQKTSKQVQPDFSPAPLNTCDTDSAEELPVQKTSKQVQPDFSPSPLNTCDTDSAEELPVQKTSKQVQPDFSPSPLNTCDTDSAEELPVQKTSKQVQPDFSPSPLNTCDTDSAEELPVQKTSKQVQPDFSPAPLNTCDTDSAEELPVQKTSKQVQPDFSPSPLNTCDTDSAEELPVQKTSKQVQPDFSPSPLNTCDTDSAEELPVQKTSKQVQPDFSPAPLNTCDTDSAEELPVQKTSKQVQPDFSPAPLNTCDTDSAEELPVQKTSKQVQPDFSPSPLNTCDTDSAEELPVQKTSKQESMTSSSDESGFIKNQVPQKPQYFFIDRGEWEKIKKKRDKRGFKGLQWTTIISQGLRTIHPYCSFAFKRHRLKVLGSNQASPEFWCCGYCRFDDCPITFTVSVSCGDLKASVEFQGREAIHNRTELKRRPVRACDREEIGKTLQHQLPRTMYLENLGTLDEKVMKSGCRDEAPSPNVLKNISWELRQKSRHHSNEILSLQVMLDKRHNSPDEVLQKVFLHPKGVLLWSKRSIQIYQERCREDIVYLDATGSIIKKEKGSPPFYVYELVVRNPHKKSSPFPVATYLTCDHTTASVTFFLEAFLTDVAKFFGRSAMRSPIMLMCDGSIVLMQAICLAFARKNLHDTVNVYFKIAIGEGSKEDFEVPILHRCLSHVMKNAKEICRKYAQSHYHLAMHVFGLLTTASTLKELDDMFESAAVVFSSPCSGSEVEKHFINLQTLMQKSGTTVDLTAKSKTNAEDLQELKGNNNFAKHYKRVYCSTPLEKQGLPNVYYCKGLMDHITTYLLPYAGLWSGIMLGDLGRHGNGQQYKDFSKRYDVLRKLTRQNITEDNWTQGIMEKSQWDLKHIRFGSSRLTRLDDFVARYQQIHTAQLKDFEDSKRVFQKKTFRVEVEKWKERRQKKRGRYVTPLHKALPFQTAPEKVGSAVAKQPQSVTKDHTENTTDQNASGKAEFSKSCQKSWHDQLSYLWKKSSTEVVVSVIPIAQGQSIIIHHSELLTLRPHHWIEGETLESLLHIYARELENGKIYILNHFTAGAILFGEKELFARQGLSKVNFDKYQAMVSFVNVCNVHWKFLYINAVNQTIYLVDPQKNSNEEDESNNAAKRFSEYLQTRKLFHGKTEWVDINWKGGVLTHPTQKDGSSCGVIVAMMARAVMKVFPDVPEMEFETSRGIMALERKAMGLQILQSSVFDEVNNCSMCSASKPLGSRHHLTNWIQCDSCDRWFHEVCLGLKKSELKKARLTSWKCKLCC